MVVLRSYRVPYVGKKDNLVLIKEFFFRDNISCRRYCIYYDRENASISDVTEHGLAFFDRIQDASDGWNLYRTYRLEGLDPVPQKDLSEIKKYNQLKEFCVIYNIMYNEHSLVNTIENGLYPIRYNDDCMVIDSVTTDEGYNDDYDQYY